MTKYEVIEELAASATVEKIVYRLLTGSKNRPGFDAPQDLIQDVYIYLLDKNDDLICTLYQKGEIGYYILRMVKNQLFSDHSYYFYKYLRFRTLSDGIDKAKDFPTEDNR